MSTFLELTNRVLNALNEVTLEDNEFDGAIGFHAQAKDAVNRAIFDIYNLHSTEWPFLFKNTVLETVAGQSTYSKASDIMAVDWDSFRILRLSADVDTISQVNTSTTVVTATPHLFKTNDSVTIYGANESVFNTYITSITVVDPVTFTYTATTDYTGSGSGNIVVKSNSVVQSKLIWIDIDHYRTYYEDSDVNQSPTSYSVPHRIVRTLDNSIIVSNIPDRIYKISYDGFTTPTALGMSTDTSLVPDRFEQVIIDRAMHYAYMFRDNIEQAALAEQRYKENLQQMRRILIPASPNMRFE